MKKTLFLLLLLTGFSYIHGGILTQDDTVKVMQAELVPTVDGQMNDQAWDQASWQSIDQVWIPYGAVVDSSDYYGHYKILWSPETNLLYFLVEIYDDVWVDGFEFSGSNETYNYDIIEVFIDQNKSGGDHLFDGIQGNGVETNAENGFTYHIQIDFPDEGNINSEIIALDLDGTSWFTSTVMDYADHFPEFALRKNGDKYCWEFSLAVYNDSYDHNNPEASRVEVSENDIIGLSVAYCDNDDPNESPKERDNFFGSVAVSEENYNSHWMNSDDYGTLLLVGKPTSVKHEKKQSQSNLRIYPNPTNGNLRYTLTNDHLGSLNIRIFNILGQEVLKYSGVKNSFESSNNLNLDFLASGTYIISAEINGSVMNKKFSYFLR